MQKVNKNVVNAEMFLKELNKYSTCKINNSFVLNVGINTVFHGMNRRSIQ